MSRREIKKALPWGAMREIAKISGVNYPVIQSFFSGKNTTENAKIITATAKFIKKQKDKENKALERLNKALGTTSTTLEGETDTTI
ncbi:MAG: hypothetical protein K2Q03_00770 [Sphingobacteriaceae bacterium]|nr:hypothetical protein [Sphingobacteriaceae bacterium]